MTPYTTPWLTARRSCTALADMAVRARVRSTGLDLLAVPATRAWVSRSRLRGLPPAFQPRDTAGRFVGYAAFAAHLPGPHKASA